MQACNNYHILEKSQLPKYGLNILTTEDKTESYLMNSVLSFLVTNQQHILFRAVLPIFSALKSIQFTVTYNKIETDLMHSF
jgi:hypothetical protein